MHLKKMLVSLLFLMNIPRLCEGGEVADDKVVSELRTELWEKERKLTDIRLEALGSADRLEQLQEAMNNMQVCVPWSSSLFLIPKFSLQFTHCVLYFSFFLTLSIFECVNFTCGTDHPINPIWQFFYIYG